MKRRAPDGREIGADYQRQCAASWARAGFTEIVSVNSKREIEGAPQLLSLASELGIRIIPVDLDASAITAKPYVFLADLLKVGCKIANGGPFAIVNADITLTQDVDLVQSVLAAARPQRFAVARRVGVDEPSGRSGEQYETGFDFFAVHGSDAEAVPDIGLIFGGPWWDHYFPLLMCARGCRPFVVPDPVAFHLEHEERWESRLWLDLGHQFLDEVLAALSSPPLASNATARAYAGVLDRAIRRDTGRVLSDLAYSARKRLPSYARAEPVKMLTRVVFANVGFLDSFADSEVLSQRSSGLTA